MVTAGEIAGVLPADVAAVLVAATDPGCRQPGLEPGPATVQLVCLGLASTATLAGRHYPTRLGHDVAKKVQQPG